MAGGESSSQPKRPLTPWSDKEFNLFKATYTLRIILLLCGLAAPVIIAIGKDSTMLKALTCLYAFSTTVVTYRSLSKPLWESKSSGDLFTHRCDYVGMVGLATGAAGSFAVEFDDAGESSVEFTHCGGNSQGLPSSGEVISGMRWNVNVLNFLNVKKALQEGMKLYISDIKVILMEGVCFDEE